MQRTNTWLAYLKKLSAEGRDPAVYSLRWAHDVRCIKSGLKHRRVGSESHFSRDWYAGYASRLESDSTALARGFSGAGWQ